MRNLLQMMQERTPGGKLHALPQALTRHLVGENVADMLDVPHTPWQYALKPIQWANLSMSVTGKNVPAMGRASEIFFRWVLQGLMDFHRQGNQLHFEIPDDLSF
jgi:hypothetical protein